MKPASRIYVAGHRGLVGSAIVRALAAAGHTGIITRTRAEVDLRDRAAATRFFAAEQPEYVFIAAAKVGGIHANASQPATFIYDNLAIQTNLIDAAWQHGVSKLLFLGSSCIYPKQASQPIREEYLLTGPLEPTNEAYAIAKIAGLKMCAAYRAQYGFNAIALMPTNIYGPGDNFDLETSHVLPALIRKAHEAKISGAASMPVWGTGRPRREFLHVDDLAEAALFCMERYSGDLALNVGVGDDVTIREVAQTICEVVGFKGELVFDATKPDGTLRKWLDVGRLNDLGWRARIGLRDGIEATYRWCIAPGGAFVD
jgi:GDP-L-fucose synthase